MLLDPKQIDIQTIRPAWIETNKIMKPSLAKDSIDKLHNKFGIPLKPPRFKVGEQVRLFWKQRSKYKWFRKIDGSGWGGNPDSRLFNKHLGAAEITEVFKIEMGIMEFDDSKIGPHNEYYIRDDKVLWFSAKISDLAKRDGFKSAEDFFQYFDSNYDLSSPKPFYVYRGKKEK